MGQKVNPVGLRLGFIKKWQSIWFADKTYSEMLHEDLKIRKYLKKKLYHAGISRIEIERAANKAKVNIYAARPGVIIGKKGSEIEKLKTEIEKFSQSEIIINILEVRKPEIDAQLVAENVAMQLERRVAFRRAMKKCVGYALKFGAKGIKINCSGDWVVRKCPARNGIGKEECHCIHCGRILIMALLRPTLLTD